VVALEKKIPLCHPYALMTWAGTSPMMMMTMMMIIDVNMDFVFKVFFIWLRNDLSLA